MVEPADLAEYQRAVRQVLTRDLITASRPRAGVLEQVLRWSDQLAHDFRELFGYQLIATTHLVRLVRRLDAFDATQGQLFARNRRPFDRRRLAYLCLVLSTFQRSRVEISLADLVRLVTPAANTIEGLGFEPTVAAHKAALVDAIDWLVDHGALRLSDGSLEAWARDDRTGDALYDIDHEICTALYKPARPVQHLTSAAGLLHAGMPDVMREARRLLVEHPVVYFSEVRPEIAEALPGAAEELARFTGMTVEQRAEGVMLADASGRFTDRPFPGQGGAVNRAAGLLLAAIADLVEEGELTRAAPTAPADADTLARIDSALPAHGIATGLAWTPAEPPPETSPAKRPSLKNNPRQGTPAKSSPSADMAQAGASVGESSVGTAQVGASAEELSADTVRTDVFAEEPSAVAVRAGASAGEPSVEGAARAGAGAAGAGEGLWFVSAGRLEEVVRRLYAEFGAASFTGVWQADPSGLLAAAVAFLADLRLLRPVAGGVLVLPAAFRYRNITLALPERGQLSLEETPA